MLNESNKIFKCKIDSKICFISINLLKNQINITINILSELAKDYSEYSNYYTLSHLQEINSYFKLYHNISDIYNDLLKLINNKNFILTINEDETISFIIKIQINGKTSKIKLSLSKNKFIYKNSIKSMDNGKIINENYNQNINYELKNRINLNEENLLLNSSPNNCNNINQKILTNKKLEEYNAIQAIFSKMDKLEDESNEMIEKIKMLEQRLTNCQKKSNLYLKNSNLDKFINKKTFLTTDNNNYNNINLYQSINSKPYNYSLYSDFEINNINKKNNLNRNRYYHSMEKDRNNRIIKIYKDINNQNHKLRHNLSSDIRYNNAKTINKISKYTEYNNRNIPIVKRENILNLNSRIIFTNKEVQLLIKRLSKNDNINKVILKLIYRASKDGDLEEIVKFKCNNKFKLLTLFYTMEGSRFGVYTEKYIHKSIRNGNQLYEIPGTSFLISLNNLIYYKKKKKNQSLPKHNNHLLCFGWCSKINNNETNWLIYTSRNKFLGKKCLFGNKNDVYLNLDYKKIVGNYLYYHIKDVEIFEVIIDNE